jgi:hypothetical protein
MFGRPPALTALQSRKQLLLAESELNRAQFKQDWQAARGELAVLTGQVRTISGFVAIGTALLGVQAAWRRNKSAPPAGQKVSWLARLIKGAALVSTLWAAVRPPSRE